VTGSPARSGERGSGIMKIREEEEEEEEEETRVVQKSGTI